MAVNTVASLSDTRDPDQLLERLASMSRDVRGRRPYERHELYHRASTSIRVTRKRSGEETEETRGEEDGLAVRTRVVGESEVRFAAASVGRGADTDPAVADLLDNPRRAPAATDLWAGADETLIDRDGDSAIASVSQLNDWLERALAGFRDSRMPGEEPEPEEAWVETAATIESWALDGKPIASRTRQRAWALLQPAPTRGTMASPRPCLVAARTWPSLTTDPWVEVRPTTRLPEDAAFEGGGRAPALVLEPESSATLVLALVRSAHTGPGPTGSLVGPGWRVSSTPNTPGALLGGDFDDTGTRSPAIPLADGEHIVGRIEGPGHFRRPSFRDFPRLLPSHLRVQPRVRTEAPDAFRANRISIHPLPTGEWILDLDGAFVVSNPEELMRCCVAGVGPDRQSHRGVETPALLFEGLAVRI